MCVFFQTLSDLAPLPDRVFSEPIPPHNTFMIPSHFDIEKVSNDNVIEVYILKSNVSVHTRASVNVKYVLQHALWSNGDDRIVL